jgi:hypothetical protein
MRRTEMITTRAMMRVGLVLVTVIAVFGTLLLTNTNAISGEIALGQVQELTSTDEDVLNSAWSPDGSRIAYVKRNAPGSTVWNIWVKEIGNSVPPIQITQDEHNVDFLSSLTWSPLGTKVIYSTGENIMAADADGSLVVSTLLSDPNGEKTYEDPDICKSDDNKRMVYMIKGVGWWGTGADLCFVEVDDYGIPQSGTEVCNPAVPDMYYPKWSYSGDKVVFTFGETNQKYDIYVANGIQDIINGTEDPIWDLGDPRVVEIPWSPNADIASGFSFDGRLVYYFEDVNGVYDFTNIMYNPTAPVSEWIDGCNFELFASNADGTGVPQNISEDSNNQAFMVASPDGTLVSFVAGEQQGDSDIYIASLRISQEITTAGGTITDGSGTTVDIPAGALEQNQTITIETPFLDDLPPSSVPPVTARIFGPAGLTFIQPVSISIYYTDASVKEYDEESLQVYYYNVNTNSWESLGGTVNAEANCITAEVTHFSLLAVMTEVNEPPVADAGDPYLVQVDSPLTLDAGLSCDPDGDFLQYRWDFGDGTPDTGWLGTETVEHVYLLSGIYNVQLSVRDTEGAEDTDSTMVVVYDPEDGFVTGGGWIESPAGACPDFCENATGKATFGFVSKYKKGATVPTGNTEFNFKTGGLNFHSIEYEWLVVNQGSTNAHFKGEGTINGGYDPNGYPFKFMLWAGDGEPDTFRIKIWWEEDSDGVENVVYDNGDPPQPIGGGSIVIHN